MSNATTPVSTESPGDSPSDSPPSSGTEPLDLMSAEPRPVVPLRVVFVQAEHDEHAGALERFVAHLESLGGLDYEVVIVDNAHPGTWAHRLSSRVLHIGGERAAAEFSAFDRAFELLESHGARSDVVVLVTDVFGVNEAEWADLLCKDVFRTAAEHHVCVGWVDADPQAVTLHGNEAQELLRTSFIALPGALVPVVRPVAVPPDTEASSTPGTLSSQATLSSLSGRLREAGVGVYDVRLLGALRKGGVRLSDLSDDERRARQWNRWRDVEKEQRRLVTRFSIDRKELLTEVPHGEPLRVLLEGWVLAAQQPVGVVLQLSSGASLRAACDLVRADVVEVHPAYGVLKCGFVLEGEFTDLFPGTYELTLQTDAGVVLGSIGTVGVLPHALFTVGRMLIPDAWPPEDDVPLSLEGELVTTSRATRVLLRLNGSPLDLPLFMDEGTPDERGLWVHDLALNAHLPPLVPNKVYRLDLSFELEQGERYDWSTRFVVNRSADVGSRLREFSVGPFDPDTALTPVRFELDVMNAHPTDWLTLAQNGAEILTVPMNGLHPPSAENRWTTAIANESVPGVVPGPSQFEFSLRRGSRRLSIREVALLVRQRRPELELERLVVTFAGAEEVLRHRIHLTGWVKNELLVDCLIVEVDEARAGVMGINDLRPDVGRAPEVALVCRQGFDSLIEVRGIAPGEHVVHVIAMQQGVERARVSRRIEFDDAPARKMGVVSDDLEQLLRGHRTHFYGSVVLRGRLRAAADDMVVALLVDDSVADEQSFDGAGEHDFYLRAVPAHSGDCAIRFVATSRGRLVFGTDPVRASFKRLELPGEAEKAVAAILDRFELRSKIVGIRSDRELAERLVEQQPERVPAFIEMLKAIGERLAQEDSRQVRLGSLSGEISNEPLKVLFISWETPSRYHGGGVYLSQLLKQLGPRHDITLIHTQGIDEVGHIDAIRPYVKKVISVSRAYRPAAFRGDALLPLFLYDIYIPELRRIIELEVASGDYDLVDYEYSTLGPYVVSGPPSAFTIHEMGHTALLNSCFDKARPIESAIGDLEQLVRMLNYDLVELPRICPNLMTLTDEDAAALMRFRPDLRVFSSPTGVDVDFFGKTQPNVDPAGPPIFVYTGNFQHPPNVRAVLFFAEEVMPLIRQQYPTAEFRIFGSRIPPAVNEFGGRNGVRIVGFVDDLRPCFAEATAFVTPIFTGTGMRIKVLEALAAGTLVIGTSLSLRGLPVRHGEHVLLADSATEFFEAACRAIRRPDEARSIAERGRELAITECNWQKAALRREAIWREVVRGEAAAAVTAQRRSWPQERREG